MLTKVFGLTCPISLLKSAERGQTSARHFWCCHPKKLLSLYPWVSKRWIHAVSSPCPTSLSCLLVPPFAGAGGEPSLG